MGEFYNMFRSEGIISKQYIYIYIQNYHEQTLGYGRFIYINGNSFEQLIGTYIYIYIYIGAGIAQSI